MKKNLLIASVVLVIICLVAGSFIFQQRVDETRQELKLMEEKQQSDMNEEQADGEEEVGKNGNVASAATLEKEGQENERDSDQSGKVGSNSSSSSSSTSTSSSAQTGQKEAVDSGTSSQAGSGTSKPDSSNGGTPNTKVESESVTSIKNRYFPEFQQLEWEYNKNLDALIEQALNDYMRNSKTFNADKYRTKVLSLESAADSSFYQKYNQVQEELTDNGHRKGAASVFEQSYKNKKADRENELKEWIGIN